MALLVSVCGLFAQELLSLDEWVKAQGLTPSIEGGTAGSQYYASCPPARAFDGITYSPSNNDRWLGSIQNGTYLKYALPDALTTSFAVQGYRLHALSAGNYNTVRAPRSWALYGHMDASAAASDEGWVLIDEQADVQWPFDTEDYDSSVTGAQYIVEFALTVPVRYMAYKFVPLTSNRPATADAWTTGLMELVFLGSEGAEEGSVYVEGEPSEVGEVSPSYGATMVPQGTETVFTAPEFAYTDDVRYQCAGYVIETLDSTGNALQSETNANARSFTFLGDGTPRRLVWLWQEHGYKLTAAPEGSGSETITADPAAEADGFYTAGTQVSLTAAGAADPVSTFRSWSGDVPEGAGTSYPLTLTVDSPKSIVANFQRRWKYAATTGDTTYPSVTDGNWTIYITANGSGYRTISRNDVTILSGSGILDFSTLYDDTTAQGTPIHLNAIGSFRGNTDITGLILGEQSIAFGQYALQGCTALTFIEMPDEVEVDLSNTYIFSGCTALKTVKLSNRIPVLGGQLFGNCSALETVTPIIPRETTTIGSAYFNCTSLKGTPDVRNLTTIVSGSAAFYNCSGITGDLDFQKLVSFNASTQYGHFEGTSVTSVRLPQAATVPFHAFYGCTSLTNVVLSESLTTLGTSAFMNCTALTNVEPWLPDSLTAIPQSAFNGCSALPTAPTAAGVTSIGSDAFSETTSMTGAFVAPLLTTMTGTGIFRHSALTSIDAPLLTALVQSAFNGCSHLERANLPAVTTAGTHAFYSCTSLKSVNMPALEAVSNEMFNECRSFEGFEGGIPSGLVSVGQRGFRYCTALSAAGTLRFPKTLTSMDRACFAYSVTDSVDLSLTKITSLPADSFTGATFQNVILPPTLTTLNARAFQSVSTLANVYFCGGVPTAAPSTWSQFMAYCLCLHVPIDPTYGWTDVIDTDLASYAGKANYNTVSQNPNLLGVWESRWVLRWVPPTSQTLITTIILH